jgi:hypothetical protein
MEVGSPHSAIDHARTKNDSECKMQMKHSGNKERKPPTERGVPVNADGSTNGALAGSIPWQGLTRNKRSVWTINTQPYKGAHFATFPEALVEPCILAGSRGPGKRCDCQELIQTPLSSSDGEIDDPTMEVGRAGMNRPRRDDEGTRPITRFQQRHYAEQMKSSPHREEMATEASTAFEHYIRTDKNGARPAPQELLDRWTALGWLTDPPAECSCLMHPGDTVLDPFCGSGTTGVVALRYHRNFIGIELKPDYVELSRQRIGEDSPLFNQVEVVSK